MRWLNGLVKEVSSITELIEPDDEPGKDSRLLGEMSEDARRLFTYCMRLARHIKDKRKQAEESDSKQQARELTAAASKLTKRLNAASAIMWEEIKYDLPDLDGQESLTFCKGWKVYSFELQSSISSILGGGQGG